jgi:hypothetical protein
VYPFQIEGKVDVLESGVPETREIGLKDVFSHLVPLKSPSGAVGPQHQLRSKFLNEQGALSQGLCSVIQL